MAEDSKQLNASRQTLYNPPPGCSAEGRQRKDGRGLHPAEQPLGPAPQEGAGPPSANAS